MDIFNNHSSSSSSRTHLKKLSIKEREKGEGNEGTAHYISRADGGNCRRCAED